MKKGFYLLMAVSLFAFSCKKKPTVANVNIVFNNTVDGLPITPYKIIYTNNAGNKYSVSLLKYFVTNVVLVQDNGNEFALNNYDLIDEFDKTNFSTVEAKAVPGGHYTKMKFNIGIDKIRNHSGAQDGDLDPSYNMIWSWNTGYIFFKHEGEYIKANGETAIMQYHLATDEAYRLQEIPIDLTVKGIDKKLNILFDLNKMYNSPSVNIAENAIMHSDNANDIKQVVALAENESDAFSFLNEE